MLQDGRRPAKVGFGKTGQQAINSSGNVPESLDLLALTMDSPPVVKRQRKGQQQATLSPPISQPNKEQGCRSKHGQFEKTGNKRGEE